MKLQPLRWLTTIFPITYARAADLARQGLIPTVKLGRSIFVDPNKIQTFIEAGGQGLEGGWRKELPEGPGPGKRRRNREAA